MKDIVKNALLGAILNPDTTIDNLNRQIMSLTEIRDILLALNDSIGEITSEVEKSSFYTKSGNCMLSLEFRVSMYIRHTAYGWETGINSKIPAIIKLAKLPLLVSNVKSSPLVKSSPHYLCG